MGGAVRGGRGDDSSASSADTHTHAHAHAHAHTACATRDVSRKSMLVVRLAHAADVSPAGTKFTRFTGTNVQILTGCEAHA